MPAARLFQYGGVRYRRTASAADRAVLVKLRRFLAVIHTICTLPRRLAMSSGTITPWTDNESEHETRKSRIDPHTNRPTFAREHPAMGNHGCERDGLPCRRSAKGRTRRSQSTCRTAPSQIQRSGSEGHTGAPQVQMLSTGPGSEGFPVKWTTHSWTPALVFARASFAPRGRSGDRSLRISVAPC